VIDKGSLFTGLQDLPRFTCKSWLTKPAGRGPASFGIVPRQFGCRL
jgi:hypothetical protein